MPRIRIALAQVNATVGDFAGNERIIIDAIDRSIAQGADLVVFPELAVTGYPPEDLLLNPAFLDACEASLKRIAARTQGITALVGFPQRVDRKLYNTAAVLHDGMWIDSVKKIELPNYGVFDEKRYFAPGEKPSALALGSALIGVTVCEDIWVPGNRIERAFKALQPGLVVNISASPFHSGKWDERLSVLRRFATATGSPLAYANLVGGQDELVFDGGSVVIAADGAVNGAAARFHDDLLVLDLDCPDRDLPSGYENRDVYVFKLGAQHGQKRPPLPEPASATQLESIDEIHRALVLGTANYVRKNGFKHVVIGLSGGIDSALVAALAVDALGAANVTGITMPSRYSSGETKSDAILLAENLGIECLTVPIDELYQQYLDWLAVPLHYGEEGTGFGPKPGIEAENLQARIRGNIIMTFSNRFGWLALTTGNKSELAMGYCTLYGDMAGGFAVLKDVFKTTAYELASHVNVRAGCELIPQSTIVRPPTAELRPDQKDEDSLPPYSVLDPILELYVQENRSAEQIAASTRADVALIRDIIRKVDLNEHKRRQGPPGVKITPRNFGKDRRMPITSRWR